MTINAQVNPSNDRVIGQKQHHLLSGESDCVTLASDPRYVATGTKNDESGVVLVTAGALEEQYGALSEDEKESLAIEGFSRAVSGKVGCQYPVRTLAYWAMLPGIDAGNKYRINKCYINEFGAKPARTVIEELFALLTEEHDITALCDMGRGEVEPLALLENISLSRLMSQEPDFCEENMGRVDAVENVSVSILDKIDLVLEHRKLTSMTVSQVASTIQDDLTGAGNDLVQPAIRKAMELGVIPECEEFSSMGVVQTRLFREIILAAFGRFI